MIQDQRRHQRIRFSQPPIVTLGFDGRRETGYIENLSLSGLVIRTTMPLEIGRLAGCEFSLFGSPLIDVPLSVVSLVGDLYGGRFQSGPVNQIIIGDAINAALRQGNASVLSIHALAGGKVMRIAGGLNGALGNDFMHALTRVGVTQIDLSGVTSIDQPGLMLCLVATRRHGVELVQPSETFATAWKAARAAPAI
jgi:hypothetical protein